MKTKEKQEIDVNKIIKQVKNKMEKEGFKQDINEIQKLVKNEIDEEILLNKILEKFKK